MPSHKKSSAEVFNGIKSNKRLPKDLLQIGAYYNVNRLDGQIQYYQFNRHEEGKNTGADFESWILTNRINFRARAQAKRLRSQKDLYASITHSSRHGLQIDN